MLGCDARLTERFPFIVLVAAADALCADGQIEVIRGSVGWSARRGLGSRAGDPGYGGPWHGDTFE